MLTKNASKLIKKIAYDPYAQATGIPYSLIESDYAEHNKNLNSSDPTVKQQAAAADRKIAEQAAMIPQARRAGKVIAGAGSSIAGIPAAMKDFCKGEYDFYKTALDKAKKTKLEDNWASGVVPSTLVGAGRALGNLLYLPARIGTKIGDNLSYILTGNNANVNGMVNNSNKRFNQAVDQVVDFIPGNKNANNIAAHTTELGTSTAVLTNTVATALGKLSKFLKPNSIPNRVINASPTSPAGLGMSATTTVADAGVTHDL